eukprot:scaffold205985_cov30-Prasinocladus_malaysianus.AAC.1
MAADALKVGETWLKQKCREHDIKRWPYRKIRSIEKSMEKIYFSMQSATDPGQLSGLHKSLEELQRHRDNICLGQPRAVYLGEIDPPKLPNIPQPAPPPEEKERSRSPSPTSTLAKRPSPEQDHDNHFGECASASPHDDAANPAKRPAIKAEEHADCHQPPRDPSDVVDSSKIDVSDLFAYEDALDLIC